MQVYKIQCRNISITYNSININCNQKEKQRWRQSRVKCMSIIRYAFRTTLSFSRQFEKGQLCNNTTFHSDKNRLTVQNKYMYRNREDTVPVLHIEDIMLKKVLLSILEIDTATIIGAFFTYN